MNATLNTLSEIHTVKADIFELRRFLADALGYIRFESTHGGTAEQMLSTLSHDLAGLYRRDSCFSPRVDGYRRWLAAFDPE